jgi:hypothetical protein
MAEDTKTLGVEVIKTVLSNPQSWLFVLVLVVIGGGIWQANISRQDRQDVMDYMRQSQLEFQKSIDDGIIESNNLRQITVDAIDKEIEALEKINRTLERMVDTNVRRTSLDPCVELEAAEANIGSELYRCQ